MFPSSTIHEISNFYIVVVQQCLKNVLLFCQCPPTVFLWPSFLNLIPYCLLGTEVIGNFWQFLVNYVLILKGIYVLRHGKHISLEICVCWVGEHIQLEICVSQIEKCISLGICVSWIGKHISLGMCLSKVGEHISLQISLGICVSQVWKHISLGKCVSQVQEHISLGFPGGETQIARDMCFLGGGTQYH